MRKTILQVACLILLTGAVSVFAQSVSGTLSGKITNASGAAVPNAAVTVTNVSNNSSQRALTGPDGAFNVSGLPPGSYRVDVETAGYKRTTQQDVILSTTGPATVTIQLEAGNTSDTVEIRGKSPAIQTTGGEMSMAIPERMLHDLPIIDRNYQELIGLEQGVTPPQPAIDMARDPARNRFASVNGQHPATNEWMNDGVWNTEPFRGTAVRVQPMESIHQLNMVTASMPAERGFVAGGLFDSFIRPGTNSWHGDLFEFYSGNILRTRTPFNIPSNPDPRFVYNQMGATFGGPIARDKTFFFGSYEGTFQNGSMTEMSTVPTAAMLGGNFSAVPGLTLYQPTTGTAAGSGRTPFAGGIIPASRINPTAAAIASFFPAPNQPGVSDNLVSNVPFRNHGDKADARLDQHFSDRTDMFLRYGFTNYWAAEASPLGNVIGAGTRSRSINQNAVVGITHDITPSLIMDLRVGYNRYDQRINALADETALGAAFGRTFANNLVGINITGLAPIGAPAWVPENPVDNTFNWMWNWSWHSSRHNVKFGTDIRRIRADGWLEPSTWGSMFGPNGTAYFGPGATLSSTGPALSQYGAFSNSFAAFLLGSPSQVGISNFVTRPTIRQSEYGFWLGDTLQLASRVSLDLGVRYDIFSPIVPRNAGGAAFFNSSNNTFNFAGIGNTNMNAWDYNLENIAPRIGMAFRATEKTVFRAGYSINYFQNPYSMVGWTAPMFGAVSGVQGGYGVAGFNGTFGPTITSSIAAPATLQNGASAGNLPATVLPTRIDTPYVESYNVQIQQEFYWGTVLQLGYVGALDRHLSGAEELNAAMPGTGAAGLPFFGMGRTASTIGFNNGLTSNYNALQVALNKSFSKGMSFTASYTWSRAMGYTTQNGMLLNPFDVRANYGPQDFDRQHNLSIGHVFELPWGRHGSNLVQTVLGGWQWNGVFTWATGAPLTITADPISCACPGNTVLANLNLNNGVGLAGTGSGSFFNPAAFSAPRLGTFGNLGRGALRGPDTVNYNMSLFKNFHVMDRFNLQLRGEAYNITNATNYAPPVTNINSPDFGRSVATVNGSYGRQVNLGLRLLF
jgi:hypothetical protein